LKKHYRIKHKNYEKILNKDFKNLNFNELYKKLQANDKNYDFIKFKEEYPSFQTQTEKIFPNFKTESFNFNLPKNNGYINNSDKIPEKKLLIEKTENFFILKKQNPNNNFFDSYNYFSLILPFLTFSSELTQIPIINNNISFPSLFNNYQF
jgi:hypothetical protein